MFCRVGTIPPVFWGRATVDRADEDGAEGAAGVTLLELIGLQRICRILLKKIDNITVPR
jgi:hypothetical protein